MSELKEKDAKAIGDAIRILTAAGFEVEKINDGEPTGDGGVRFDLHVRGRTAYEAFWGRVDVMKEAAIEMPEIGMDGSPVEEDD